MQKNPSARARGALSFVAKIAVAALLIGWLVRRGTLDFHALGILFQRPSLFVGNLALFAFACVMVTLRWRILLRLAGVELSFARALPLQLTAQFFNVVTPGAVTGDLVKALYAARDAKPEARTTILLVIFVERILGLAGLVVLCLFIAVARGGAQFQDPAMRPLALGVVALGVGALGGPVALVVFMRLAGSRLEEWTSGPSRIAKTLNKLVFAVRLLSASPRALLIALAYAMIAHAAAIGYFTVLARAITGTDVSFSTVATVFPLGILTVLVPISPSGMGVGHVAFDRLFAIVGVTGGATIFNVYVLGQLVPNLIGVVPYLSLKRRGEIPTTSP